MYFIKKGVNANLVSEYFKLEKKSEKSNVLRLKEIPDERNRITRWNYSTTIFGVRDIRIGKEDYLNSGRFERENDVITRWN